MCINFKDLSELVSVLKGETDILGLTINLCPIGFALI